MRSIYTNWRSKITKLDYKNWQEKIAETIQHIHDDITLYWPTNQNFKPVTTFYFSENDNVYRVKNIKFKTDQEFEDYLKEHDDIALYYSCWQKGIGEPFIVARMVHLKTGMSTVSTPLDEFLQDMPLHSSNAEFGTLDGIKAQVDKIEDDIGNIFCLLHTSSESGKVSLRIEQHIVEKSTNLVYTE